MQRQAGTSLTVSAQQQTTFDDGGGRPGGPSLIWRHDIGMAGCQTWNFSWHTHIYIYIHLLPVSLPICLSGSKFHTNIKANLTGCVLPHLANRPNSHPSSPFGQRARTVEGESGTSLLIPSGGFVGGEGPSPKKDHVFIGQVCVNPRLRLHIIGIQQWGHRQKRASDGGIFQPPNATSGIRKPLYTTPLGQEP